VPSAHSQLIVRRIYGLALGYENLNNHEQFRRDPLMALLAGSRNLEEPLAGKSTLNRLELPGGSQCYLKIDSAPEQLDALSSALGKDVLQIERFDCEKQSQGWLRKPIVSALTLFGLDEMIAKYAGYQDLAEIIPHRLTNPADTLRELFGRIVFNILCGNTDDQAR
jgi:HipA-like C-terminal domain/Transposase DDE domain group 1